MAVLPVVKAPHPILTKPCETVTEFNDDLVKFIEDMKETMLAEDGCGLAANQVGVGKKIMITKPDHEDPSIFVYINPEVVEESEETCSMEEGCLSVPENGVEVERAESIRIKYQNVKWEWREEELTGFPARVILHEMDHLQGKLIIDYVSQLKKEMILRKLRKLDR